MVQIMTPRGIAYVSRPSDAGNICRDFVSEEFAQYIEQELERSSAEEIYAKEKLNMDLGAAESEVEFYRDLLFEIKEVVEQTLSTAEHRPKMQKATILKELERIDQRITSNL